MEGLKIVGVEVFSADWGVHSVAAQVVLWLLAWVSITVRDGKKLYPFEDLLPAIIDEHFSPGCTFFCNEVVDGKWL
jgi:hypothetical protein